MLTWEVVGCLFVNDPSSGAAEEPQCNAVHSPPHSDLDIFWNWKLELEIGFARFSVVSCDQII